MNTLRKTLLFCVLLTLLAMTAICLLPGCTGRTARTKTLLPAIASAWQSLRTDAVTGAADPNDLEIMDTAVATGNSVNLTVGWNRCRDAVTAGIESLVKDEAISSHLYAAKSETVTRMDAAVKTYAGP